MYRVSMERLLRVLMSLQWTSRIKDVWDSVVMTRRNYTYKMYVTPSALDENR